MMQELIKPSILKQVIIGERPRKKIKRENKIIDLLTNLGEEENKIYNFLKSYNTVNKWLEEYLININELGTQKSYNFILDLVNTLIKFDYYKPYYNEEDLDKVVNNKIDIIKKSLNKELVKFDKNKSKFTLKKSNNAKDKLNKDIYSDLYEEFTSLQK